MYTSGTTGKPKGAIRNHQGLALISLVTALDMGLSRDDTALLVMPMCHANSLYFGCSFAYIGATVVVDDSKHFSPEALLATIASREITFTSLVPTHFIMALGLAEEVKARYDVSRIRKLMISSAPARKDTKLAILEHFRNSQLYELYGSTEAGWVTLLRPDEQIEHLGSVGREWTGSGPVKILDPYGNEVSDSEVGELFSCTPYTFDGYFNDPAKTAEALRADGYCSVGDLARRDEHGFIHLVDRKSNMIISGGENIYPSEIENLLGRYPGIKDVAVVGVPHEKWGEAVHAVIVMHDGSTADERDVLDWCRDKVAGYKRPRSVSFIAESEMPRTATGKIQHRVLRDRYAKAKA
jgi:acyl-CoA synthetase (AMP-forming)/AMP-acid ligase II